MRNRNRDSLSRRRFVASVAAFGALGVVPAVKAQEQPPVIEPVEPEGETVQEPIAPEEGQSTGEIEQIAEQATGEYFAETGHNIVEPFLSLWRQAGGVDVLGMPLSEERFASESGAIEQYFEGIVFVNDPTLEGVWAMQGMHIGDDRIADVAPASAREQVSGCEPGDASCQFFPEMGHTISGAIAELWNRGGGAPVFGFPRSEPFREESVTRQVFEKVILEVNSSGEVTALPVGRQIMEENGLEGDPAFLPAPPTLGTSTLVTASVGGRSWRRTGSRVTPPSCPRRPRSARRRW